MRSSQSGTADAARRPAWLTAKPYAHRGLHGAGRTENSLAAFEAAIAAGFGIELDVQASRDGVAMVFHDRELDRLTGAHGPVAELRADQLRRVKLNGMEETIPGLAEMLTQIASRAPVLVEMKSPDRKIAPLCRSVLKTLEAYPGPAAIMSFNPAIGHWFAVHAPHLTRGLVVAEQGKKGFRGWLERRLSLWRARPDFLACDIRDLPSRFASAARVRGLAVLTWTVRSPRDREAAAVHADQIIHELPQDR
jgi:glycerophosphoryl diester phosphodiesterase